MKRENGNMELKDRVVIISKSNMNGLYRLYGKMTMNELEKEVNNHVAVAISEILEDEKAGKGQNNEKQTGVCRLQESYCGTREYFFEYSEPQMAHDHKQNLSDKAMQCILRKEALPYGIYLVDCRLHNIYTAAQEKKIYMEENKKEIYNLKEKKFLVVRCILNYKIEPTDENILRAWNALCMMDSQNVDAEVLEWTKRIVGKNTVESCDKKIENIRRDNERILKNKAEKVGYGAKLVVSPKQALATYNIFTHGRKFSGNFHSLSRRLGKFQNKNSSQKQQFSLEIRRKIYE